MTEQTETIDALRARAHWYRLLAGVFAEEPRGAFLHELRSPECLSALTELGAQFGDDFLQPEEAVLGEALACEYTMLFVAPGGFPPVESVRLQGGYRQSAASEIRAFYAEEGFAAEGGRFAAFEDHLAVEMQFVAALIERQAVALAEGNGPEAARLGKRIKKFWVLHLGRWVRGYAALLEEVAEHSFFREMARLLAAFADAELAMLDLAVEDADGGRWRAPKPEQVTQPMQCGGTAA